MKEKQFEKLRIISSNYKIVYHNEIKDAKGILLDGRILETEQTIFVLKSMPYARQLQVIVHEAMHGIDFEMCLNLKNEEDRINQFTTGITCFIRDNPEFIMEFIKVLNKK